MFEIFYWKILSYANMVLQFFTDQESNWSCVSANNTNFSKFNDFLLFNIAQSIRNLDNVEELVILFKNLVKNVALVLHLYYTLMSLYYYHIFQVCPDCAV